MTNSNLGNLVDNKTLCKFIKWYLSNPLQIKATRSSGKYSFKDCAYAKQFLYEAQHTKRPIAFREKLLELCGLGDYAINGKNLAENQINEEAGECLGLHGSSSDTTEDEVVGKQWSATKYLKYLSKQRIVPFNVVSHVAKKHNEHTKELAAEYNKKMKQYVPSIKKIYAKKIAVHEANLHHFYWWKKAMHLGNKDLMAINRIKKIRKRILDDIHQFLHTKVSNESWQYDLNYDEMRLMCSQGCKEAHESDADIFHTDIINHHFFAPATDGDKSHIVHMTSPLSKLAVYAFLKSKLSYIRIQWIKSAPCFKSDTNVENVLDISINYRYHPVTDTRIMNDYKRYIQNE